LRGAIAVAEKGLAACIKTQTPAAVSSTPAAPAAIIEVNACTTCEAELATYLANWKSKTISEKVPAPSFTVAAASAPQAAALTVPACLASAGFSAKGIAAGVDSACKPALSFQNLIHTAAPVPVKPTDNGNELLNRILFGGQRAVAHYELNQSRESHSFVSQAMNLFFPRLKRAGCP